jgi:hypothetical protein
LLVWKTIGNENVPKDVPLRIGKRDGPQLPTFAADISKASSEARAKTQEMLQRTDHIDCFKFHESNNYMWIQAEADANPPRFDDKDLEGILKIDRGNIAKYTRFVEEEYSD